MNNAGIAVRMFGAICAVWILVGCANPYERFYYPINHSRARISPTNAVPEVRNVGDAVAYAHDLEDQGYRAIGASAFMTSGEPSERDAAKQGQAIGADLVLRSAHFSHAEQAAMPVVNYQPGQTYQSQVSGSLYSGGQVGNYYGSVTTTTPGTYTTQCIPYTRRVYDYKAVFMRKL